MTLIVSNVVSVVIGFMFSKVVYFYSSNKDKRAFKKFKNYGNEVLLDIVREMILFFDQYDEISAEAVHDAEIFVKDLNNDLDNKIKLMNYYISNKDILLERRENRAFWLYYIEIFETLIKEYKEILSRYTFHDTSKYKELHSNELKRLYNFQKDKITELKRKNEEFDTKIQAIDKLLG